VIIHATFKQHLSNHLVMYLWNLYVWNIHESYFIIISLSLYFPFLKMELHFLEKGTEKVWINQKWNGGRTRQPLVICGRKNKVKSENYAWSRDYTMIIIIKESVTTKAWNFARSFTYLSDIRISIVRTFPRVHVKEIFRKLGII